MRFSGEQGFISSGTYGRVYKAVTKNAAKVHLPTTIPANSQRELFAIKKYVRSPQRFDVFGGRFFAALTQRLSLSGL